MVRSVPRSAGAGESVPIGTLPKEASVTWRIPESLSLAILTELQEADGPVFILAVTVPGRLGPVILEFPFREEETREEVGT